MMGSEKMKVCVIGAGAAGLACARRLASRLDFFDFVVYEQGSEIGGQWFYNDKSKAIGVNCHSSMYKNMRTNIPKEVMGYPGFPFPSGGSSFIHHSEIQKYLLEFAEQYDLYKYIKFHHKIIEVKPNKPESNLPKWTVTTMEIKTKTVKQDYFDSVTVCNGRYSKPNVPELPGQNTFPGRLIHSHFYRDNASFENETVVCLGRGPSGLDISLEIAQVAKKVLISHNKELLMSTLPSNTSQVTGIASIEGNKVTFKNGQVEQVDSIVLCTGYQFEFSFLHKDCRLQVADGRVTPLYKHFINIEHPTMAIWGVTFVICPFPFYDSQAVFFVKSLEGKCSLPSKEEMFCDEEEEFLERKNSGLPVRYSHRMGPLQWAYQDKLFEVGNIEGTNAPQVIRELYDYVHKTRVKDLMHYKDISYLIQGDKFVLVSKDEQ